MSEPSAGDQSMHEYGTYEWTGSDRERIDPRGQYRSAGFRSSEKLALRVLRLLSCKSIERTRDVFQIESYGDAEPEHSGIIVVITPEAIEIRFPTVEWTKGCHAPVLSSQIWRRAEAAGLKDRDLGRLLDEAQQLRNHALALCRYCKKRFPPEQRVLYNQCYACRARHGGISY